MRTVDNVPSAGYSRIEYAPTKPLEISTLRTVRSMQAVFCRMLREKIALFFRGLPTDRGPFKAALVAFIAEDYLLGGRGV